LSEGTVIPSRPVSLPSFIAVTAKPTVLMENWASGTLGANGRWRKEPQWVFAHDILIA
jgi:hypothetical protein